MSTKMPKIMLVDMNSFFASVEQQANPFLRGKPIGVCASLHDTSCLIATSREAKALGIKTGTLVYKARKIYPKIAVIQSEPEKYREVQRKINRIFQDYTDRVEVYSIDEAFLDLSDDNPSGLRPSPLILGGELKSPLNIRGGRGSYKNSLLIGAEIKKRIKQEVGEWLTCSVGLGQNKFLAKLATDLKKPDGLSLIFRQHLPMIYKNKKFTDLWGVAGGWERRLAKLGILSPLQVLDYPVQNLISVFGKPGYYVWERVNGLEEDRIDPSTNSGINSLLPERSETESKAKSFGHSWVLNFRTTDKTRLAPVILRLAEKAARRMRAEGFQAYGVGLSVTLVDGTHFGQSKKLKYSIDTGLDFYYEALKIWEPWKFEKEVMHIAVRFAELIPRTCQLSLFNNPSQPPLNIRGGEKFPPLKIRGGQGELLTKALDAINDKYGEFVIRPGLLTKTADYAPDAIAFGK